VVTCRDHSQGSRKDHRCGTSVDPRMGGSELQRVAWDTRVSSAIIIILF
jgi:hypothetical protein